MGTIPTEILQLIFENLEIVELYSITKVNSRWREVAGIALASKFKDTTITLWLDQEGHRPFQPLFKFDKYDSTSKLMRFIPITPSSNKDVRDVFNTAFGISSPTLRLITVGNEDNMDYLDKERHLDVKNAGHKTLIGRESINFGLRSSWILSYSVEKFVRPDGRRVPGERWLIPEAFECSVGFLNPNCAHRSKLIWYIKRSMRKRNEEGFEKHDKKKIHDEASEKIDKRKIINEEIIERFEKLDLMATSA